MAVKSYRDLLVWQKAMDFVVLVYQFSRAFPREEQFALTAQLRKASVSVPSNIAEGQGRFSDREFANFLSIAHGSLSEAETQIIIAQRLVYLSETETSELLALASEVGRMIHGLTNAIGQK